MTPCHSQNDEQIASEWKLPGGVLRFGEIPHLMGIVNVTPDSFSDGGMHFGFQAAVDYGVRLVDEGADMLDVGGESTRPYSTPVDVEEELKRVVPVIQELSQRVTVPISIDTSKAIVAREAVRAGAQIINDVCGFKDEQMIGVAQETGVALCAMHMQGTPQDMQDNPSYGNVVEDVFVYLQSRRDELVRKGIDSRRICLDPGIGFGKTYEQNLALLRNGSQFHRLGCPLLIGHSRKGYIAKVIGDKQRSRLAGTLGVSLTLARQRIQILRVHDVQEVCDALNLFRTTGGLE